MEFEQISRLQVAGIHIAMQLQYHIWFANFKMLVLLWNIPLFIAQLRIKAWKMLTTTCSGSARMLEIVCVCVCLLPCIRFWWRCHCRLLTSFEYHEIFYWINSYLKWNDAAKWLFIHCKQNIPLSSAKILISVTFPKLDLK